MEGDELEMATALSKVVLLIDDDEDDFDLFNNVLREVAPDHKAILLTKVDDLQGYFGSHPRDIPCLVVTDLNLPPSDGFEVITLIKGDPKYSLIPVVVYSNSVNPKDIVRAGEVGATAYVHKATSITQIYEDVKKMMKYCRVT